MRIIGIDPGSRTTGYGVVEVLGVRTRFVDCGPIQLGDDAFPIRLARLHRALQALLEEYQPHVAAVEQVFMARNPDSALKLGQARGVALAALALRELPVVEYSARAVKQAIVGGGGADKAQIQHMVKVLCQLPEPPQADAADALAVALCHGHHAQSLSAVGVGANAPGQRSWRSAGGRRRGGRMWRLPAGNTP